MSNRLRLLAFLTVVCIAAIARADDAYFSVSLSDLKAVAAGPVPADPQERRSNWFFSNAVERTDG